MKNKKLTLPADEKVLYIAEKTPVCFNMYSILAVLMIFILYNFCSRIHTFEPMAVGWVIIAVIGVVAAKTVSVIFRDYGHAELILTNKRIILIQNKMLSFPLNTIDGFSGSCASIKHDLTFGAGMYISSTSGQSFYITSVDRTKFLEQLKKYFPNEYKRIMNAHTKAGYMEAEQAHDIVDEKREREVKEREEQRKAVDEAIAAQYQRRESDTMRVLKKKAQHIDEIQPPNP